MIIFARPLVARPSLGSSQLNSREVADSLQLNGGGELLANFRPIISHSVTEQANNSLGWLIK